MAPIPITRAEYEAKYGGGSGVTSSPIPITRAEYEAKFNPVPSIPQISANQTSLGRLASVGQGGFGGFLDEAGAGVQSLGGYLGALSSGNPENLSLGDIYSENLAKNRAGYEQYQEADPMASTALNIGGSVLSPINKLAMGAKAPTLLKTAGASALQGGIYGAGQAEGNENLLKEVGQGALLSGGTTGVLGLAGKAIGSVANKADDLAQATQNKLFGLRSSDITNSLRKDVIDTASGEAPIIESLNRLAKKDVIQAGKPRENLARITKDRRVMASLRDSIIDQADQVQSNPININFNRVQSTIKGLDPTDQKKAYEIFDNLRADFDASHAGRISELEQLKKTYQDSAKGTFGNAPAVDNLTAKLKGAMSTDIKSAVDNELLSNPIYGKLGDDLKTIRQGAGDRIKLKKVFENAVAREKVQDADSLITGLLRTSGGYGVPVLLGAGAGEASGVGWEAGALGAGLALRSTAGKKALVKLFQGTSKAGQPLAQLAEAVAPVAGQAVRQLNESEPAIVMPEAQTPVKKLGDLIAKDMTKKEDNKQVLLSSLVDSGITDPDEAKQFLAQMEHESGGFKSMVERGSGAKYEGRKDLGNTQKGDGERFKGRGFIQLTGRFNYDKYGKMLGIDLVNNPELAADPEVASKIAIAYWNDRVKPKVKDFKDIKAVTKIINGGYNGLDDRIARFKKYDNNEEILALLNDLASRKA